MFNLIVVATNLFMGQYQDMPSCQSAIRAIYFQRLAVDPESLSKSQLIDLGKKIEIVVKTQREFVCVPAKQG